MFLQVAVEGVPKPLIYQISEDGSSEQYLIGSFVEVPIQKRISDGIIIAIAEKPDFDVKSIIGKPVKVYNAAQIPVLRAIADYYCQDFFTVSSSLAPPVLRWKGIKRTHKKQSSHTSSEPFAYSLRGSILTLQQKDALAKILESSASKVLLRGETGSGKTELYIELVKHALENGQGVLILIPEIALSPQIAKRFCDAISREHVAILHSDLKKSERYLEWVKVLYGEKTVVIGTRSSIMAPVRNLKYIIIDEEHDRSYKQNESAFRYHACSVAEIRADLEGARLLLGSATPRIETYFLAKNSKNWAYVYLPPFSSRYSQVFVDIIDIKKSGKATKSLTFPAITAINQALLNKEQVIVFYNRVGYCWSLYCSKCGYSSHCPNCAVSLRVIKARNKQYCSICGFSKEIDKRCPLCGAPLLYLGSGTEQIYEEITKLFPTARVIRLDKESVSNYKELFQVLDDFSEGKIDILVSTQLVSKGHNFKNLTLVVAANPDIGRNIPDFRSSEYFIQLFTQLAGRLGRWEKPGRMVIQTNFPNDPVYSFLKTRDIEAFYNQELLSREKYELPPFKALVRFLSTSKKSVLSAMKDLEKLKDLIGKEQGCEILGPSPCYYNKLKGAYRAHMLVKFKSKEFIPLKLQEINKEIPKSIIYDIEPFELI